MSEKLQELSSGELTDEESMEKIDVEEASKLAKLDRENIKRSPKIL